MAALQYIDVPGYSAAIFRRTKPEMLMPDAPLARAKRWFLPAILAGRCRWDDDSNTFFFKTRPGAPESLLHFGYLSIEKDMGRYQGSAFQFIGVDELTFWREDFYRFLFSRCRPSAQLLEPVPCRVRATTNPGGPGHRWVKERFVARAVHVRGTAALHDIAMRAKSRIELPTPALYVSPPSSDAIELARELGRRPRQAYFVPAFASDNPFLVGEKLAAYREQLLMLDPVRRKQLEWGDWEVESTGGFFTRESFEVVDALPKCSRIIRSWDLAATEETPGRDPDFTAGPKVGMAFDADTKKKLICVSALELFREEPPKTEKRVVLTAKQDGVAVHQLFEVEGGSSGKLVMSNWHALLAGHTVRGIRKTGPKDTYWRPLAGYAANVHPVLLLRATWNDALISQLCALPVGHDDIADAVSQAYSFFIHGGAPSPVSVAPVPEHFDTARGM